MARDIKKVDICSAELESLFETLGFKWNQTNGGCQWVNKFNGKGEQLCDGGTSEFLNNYFIVSSEGDYYHLELCHDCKHITFFRVEPEEIW